VARLDEAVAGSNPGQILVRIEELDGATKAWAGRRMDRAIPGAIAGRALDEVDDKVAHARGVDAHVQEHERRRAAREQGG
jgi:molecular chaperone HscA